MEITIILAVLVAFAFLAPRFGHDSSDTIANKEQDFARYGYTWNTLKYDQQLADQIQAARQHQPQPRNVAEAA